MEKRGYRAKDAANYMGISLSGFWLLVKDGFIAKIKLSERVTIFEKEELDRYIEGKKNVQ